MLLEGSSDLIAYLAAYRYLHKNEDGVRSGLTAWRRKLIRNLDRDYALEPADALILDHLLMEVVIESFSLGWAACNRQRQNRKGRPAKPKAEADAAPGSSLDVLA